MTSRTLAIPLTLASLLAGTVARAEPPESTAVIPEAPQPEGEVSFVHIESVREVALEFRRGGDVDWVRVCTSPCDQVLSREGDFRITGRDLQTSDTFALVRGTRTANLQVRPTTKSARVFGVLGVVTGAITVGLSVLAYLGAKEDASVSPIRCGLGLDSLAHVGLGDDEQTRNTCPERRSRIQCPTSSRASSASAFWPPVR
jgi:hypothetical protein